ncbi:zinc ABC transporter substrate-binding protein [Allosediminivita pacifica]|uniref:High-affinity zinc uptake system protein ZnuA n=1 Tax=Allosediminivita pacifica TaxID=1267769 RepID=A0A2T6AZK4_9RHOB|nr:zinc ABC transporter substrate-binding protein [Allosediminivita pacifica]PTX49269.1 zinc transport system substrate-binding protein [Allosediminivita pacifica]GGB05391.1 hypothetical protein GCM10011324_14400 [Allosediminivita pacifica]
MRRSDLSVCSAMAMTVFGVLAGTARAEVPVVAVDIPPVHALAARVMEGMGEPQLILPPGSSPHSASLRPSEAGMLEGADVVFWVGPELAPWLGDTLETLAGDAEVVELLEVEGTRVLEFREGPVFAEHDHGDEDHDHDEAHAHDEDDHGDHDHDEGQDHADHDDHDHEAHDDEAGHDHEDEHAEHDGHDEDHAHDDGHGHSHDGIDPHAWLDPVNAQAWVAAMAETLAEADPENAETYRANAEAARGELDALIGEIEAQLDGAEDATFFVFHDAYHYFEARFGVEAMGSLSLSDASDPSPRRLAEIRDTIRAEGAHCVFAEPQFDDGIVSAVADGSGASVAVIDPLGVGLETGAGLYPALLRELSAAFADCR